MNLWCELQLYCGKEHGSDCDMVGRILQTQVRSKAVEGDEYRWKRNRIFE